LEKLTGEEGSTKTENVTIKADTLKQIGEMMILEKSTRLSGDVIEKD
jgi:hypothetical protein